MHSPRRTTTTLATFPRPPSPIMSPAGQLRTTRECHAEIPPFVSPDKFSRYYFSAPFSGVIAPAAHNLVVGLMSNHSASNPGGELPTNVLSSFFSVTGEPGNFVHTRGNERVPFVCCCGLYFAHSALTHCPELVPPPNGRCVRSSKRRSRSCCHATPIPWNPSIRR
jgi:hypothetical protein